MWNMVHGYPTGNTAATNVPASTSPATGPVRVRQPSSSPSDQEEASLLSTDSPPPNTYSYYFQNISWYAVQNNQPDTSEITWKERIKTIFKDIWRKYTCAVSVGFAVICLIIIVTCAHAIENALVKEP